MQHYEIKNYFGRSYASTCQHCGITIYRRNKNGNGKHAWLAYSKAAYRADAEFEVLCRGCYDKAVKEYGPVISREEMLKRIDKAIYKCVAKREQGLQRQGEKLEEVEIEVEEVEKAELTNTDTPFGTSSRTLLANTSSGTSESFKPYPIYTRGNVNMLLKVYRKVKKTRVAQDSTFNEENKGNKEFEATVRKFLTFITGFTVGAGMTKRPVMLDAAHKYIARWVSDGHVDMNTNLSCITDFFNAMASLGMIRDSVAKKAGNICLSISKAKSDKSDSLVVS